MTYRRPDLDFTAIHQRWPQVGREWERNIKIELAALCARFHATPVRVMPARYSFVVLASSPKGDLIMRSTPDPNGPIQAEVLAALADLGVAPRIHDVVMGLNGPWIIMERVVPGTSLAEADLSMVHIESLVSALRRMVGQSAPRAEMTPVGQWLRERLEDDHLTELPIGQQPAPIEERREAAAILDELNNSSENRSLCHGDASPGNVLIGDQGRVFLIDPRGVSGEVGYDVAVLALKRARGELLEAQAIAAELAGRVGVDPGRAVRWAAVASAARV